MSTSVYPVVGRVKPSFVPELELTTMVDGVPVKSPMPPPGEPTPPDVVQLLPEPWSSLGLKQPQPSDFEFSYPDKEYEPDHPQNVLTHMYDNYPLFSWLADVRGNCQPRLDYQLRLQRTEQFIDAIGNAPGVTYVDFAGHRQKNPKDTLREHYFDSFCKPIMFGIDELLEFNYDTFAYVQDKYDSDGNPLYRIHPDGKTWRQLFDGTPGLTAPTKGYFEFLAEAKAKGWGFVIFCFD